MRRASYSGRLLGDGRGFSLPEVLIAVAILLLISSTVTSGIMQVVNSFRTITDRTALAGSPAASCHRSTTTGARG